MSIKGTLREMEASVTMNGQPLDYAELSAITRLGQRLGFARIVGEVPPATGKGKPSKVWEIDSTVTLTATQT